MSNHTDEQQPTCSFCGKNRLQVRKLIQGPEGVFICDECAQECNNIIRKSDSDAEFDQKGAAQLDEYPEDALPVLNNLPTPHEIYDEL